MSYCSHSVIIRVLLATMCGGAWGVPAQAGSEDFANFSETGKTYNTATFLGQDGSTWSYTSCAGFKTIDAPSPGLGKKKDPLASIESGTLTGGCGTLKFDWMQMYNTAVNFDVFVNGSLYTNITGGTFEVPINTGPLLIEQGGDFTIKIQQHEFESRQVAIDNIEWTPYSTGVPTAPELQFSTATNHIRVAYSNRVQFDVTAIEPNEDTLQLWATGVPTGASFSAITGSSPLTSQFSWIPTESQTGLYSIVFYAGDKDGTNSLSFSIEVTPIYPYYHYALYPEGLMGTDLKIQLHEIISTGSYELIETNNELLVAMMDIHTDPANTNNVLLLYNPTSSVPKSAYNSLTNAWNKEHCWPDSHGLGDGPDGVDIHNLYAADKAVNALRSDLFFDKSNPADPGYRSPATNAAPETSMDANSFEPPDASKGNVARAIFYMATRYDGTEPKTAALSFSDDPTTTNTMGILTTLLAWHLADPPDAAESNRNELIYTLYQFNRNPFIDHPEWAEAIWGTDTDGDGSTATYEEVAGTDPANSNSFLQISIVHTNSSLQMGCGLLTTGSTYRLYQGAFVSNDIVWHEIATTNRLQGSNVNFTIAPTSRAAFYHLRAVRP